MISHHRVQNEVVETTAAVLRAHSSIRELHVAKRIERKQGHSQVEMLDSGRINDITTHLRLRIPDFPCQTPECCAGWARPPVLMSATCQDEGAQATIVSTIRCRAAVPSPAGPPEAWGVWGVPPHKKLHKYTLNDVANSRSSQTIADHAMTPLKRGAKTLSDVVEHFHLPTYRGVNIATCVALIRKALLCQRWRGCDLHRGRNGTWRLFGAEVSQCCVSWCGTNSGYVQYNHINKVSSAKPHEMT
jgi:hypothetical protein